MEKKYFKVINPKIKKLIIDTFNNPKEWAKNLDTFKVLLKCEVKGNMSTNPDQLVLREVPDHLKREFKKDWSNNYGGYVAKKNSNINKEFVKLCKDLNLTSLTAVNIAMAFNTLLFGSKCSFHYFDNKDECYIETSEDMEKDKDSVQLIEETIFLEEQLLFKELQKAEKIK